MRKFAIIAALLLIAAPSMAQTCQLGVSGTLNPGDTLTIALTDSLADSLTLMAVGETAGSTAFNFGPLGGFTIDLDAPFIFLPFGFTDANGDASLSISVPAGASLPASVAGTTVILQTVSVGFGFGSGTPGLSTCVSNTATLTL